jgi:hypothetical protein
MAAVIRRTWRFFPSVNSSASQQSGECRFRVHRIVAQ